MKKWILLPILLVILNSLTLYSANIEGTWVRKHDLNLNGKLDGKIGKSIVKFNKKNGELIGIYGGSDYTVDRRYFNIFVSPKKYQVNVVTMTYEDKAKPSYFAVFTGKMMGNDKIIGTWYDTRGNTGDVEFVKEKEESYIGGTYEMKSLDGKWAYFPAFGSVILTNNKDFPPFVFKIIEGVYGKGNISFISIKNNEEYLRTNEYIFNVNVEWADKNHLNHASFKIIPGLAGEGVSFESIGRPGKYIRAKDDGAWAGNKKLYVESGNDEQFKKDATFILKKVK